MYSNARGESVYAYDVFRAMNPEAVHTHLQKFNLKVHKRRKQRRIGNGRIKPYGTHSSRAGS